MPSQTFFDIAVIHLLTTATINRLRELYPKGRFEVRRFRPNIVIESAPLEKDLVENSWVGKIITIGKDRDSAVILRVSGRCTRCVMTTLPQGDLPKDLGILSCIARYNQVSAGVYASVLRGGIIRRGRSHSTRRRIVTQLIRPVYTLSLGYVDKKMSSVIL